MKKHISILLTIVMIFTFFAGCNSQDNSKSYKIGVNQFGQHGSLDNCYAGFIEGLKQEGIVEGENLTIQLQNANFSGDTANIIAQSFVSDKMDLICGIATPSAQACYNAADGEIPVIYTAVTDPNAAMLVDGNVTGTSDELPVEAQLKMIRALLPDAKNIGILYTTSEPNSVSSIAKYESMAKDYGFNIITTGISTATDIPLAAETLVPQVDCITNLTDNTVVGQLPIILEIANKKNIPVFGSEIEQVKLGCAAAEGLEYFNLGIQTGKIAAKVLKGEATAQDIPYEILTESEFTINSTVLQGFGITVPEEYKQRAIDVAE